MKRFLAPCLLAMLLVGCSSDSESDQIVRTGEVKAAQLQNGRLNRDPAPLTLKDVSVLPSGSPERAVMQLLFWAQWGSAPEVAAAYDPGITDRLGITVVTGPYNWLRPQLVVSRPRIVTHTRTDRGAFVAVELASKPYPLQRESFTLRRKDGKWMVVYDTLAERGLQSLVTEREAKDPAKPGPAAVSAGRQAAHSFRDTATTILLGR